MSGEYYSFTERPVLIRRFFSYFHLNSHHTANYGIFYPLISHSSNMTDLKKETKNIAKHSSVYMLGTVLNKIVGFLMIPIYTSLLLPSDYGILQLVSLSTEMIGMVISSGIAAAMYRFYFDYKEEKERNEVISTAIIGFSIIAALSLTPLSFYSGQLSLLILDSSNYYYYFLISFASLWLSTIVQMGYGFLRIQEKSLLFISFSVTRLLLGLSFNIYFVVIKRIGVLGILLSTLISSLILVVILISPMLYKIKPRFSFSKCKAMLKYGAPLIPTSLAAFVVHSSDRFFIKSYSGLSEAGIYSLGYKFGNLPNTFISSPFMQIWEVRFFKSYKDEGAEKLFGKMFTYLCFLVIFAGLGISVLIKDILIFISDKAYWDAYKIVPIIILAYIIFSFQYFFNMGIYFFKRTEYLAYINVSNAIINLILNFYLIKLYGIWGAAIATILCFSYKAILTYYISNKLYKIYFESFRIIKLFLVSFGIFIVCYQLDLNSITMNLIIKTSIAMLFPFILFLFRFFTAEELQAIRAFIKKIFEFGLRLNI